MAGADGHVIIKTAADNSQLEKDLAKTTKEVEKLEKQVAQSSAERNPIAEKLETARAEADKARKSVEALQQSLADNKNTAAAAGLPTSATAKSVEAMERQVAKTQADIAPVAEQLRKAQAEASAAAGAVQRLKKELASSEAITSINNTQAVDPMQYIEAMERQEQIKAQLKEQEAIEQQKGAAAEKLDQKYTQMYSRLQQQTAELERQRAAVEATGQQSQITAQLREQERLLREKEREVQRLEQADARILQKLQRQTQELQRQKAAAGELEGQLRSQSGAVDKIVDGVGNRVDKLGKRIMGMVKRVFFFTLITSALRGVRSWIGSIISANDEASSSMARLKGALLTMAQPLIDVIIPAFITLVNVLTRVVTAIAGFLAMLSGKSINQTKDAAKKLNEEASAIKKTGEEAKKAAGFLAGFDEVNSVPEDNAGAASASSKAPDFNFDTSTMEVDFKKLLNWIKVIAAALLGLKLGKGFKDSLQKTVGLMIAITGAIELIKGAWDAWQNGLNWDNFKQIIGGMLLLVAGLGIAFGPIGAAIGLIVSGLIALGVAFKDAMENGWNLQNVLLAIAGIMAAGIGIGILLGSWIPALIAAIASVLLAITVATGHGEELIAGVKQILQGFLDFFAGIFSGDMERAMAGIIGIFDGLKVAVFAIIDGIRDFLLKFLDWLDEKTGGKLHGIIQFCNDLVTGFFDNVKKTVGEFVESFKEIFSGITKFLTGIFTADFDLALDGLKDMIKGTINSITSLLTGAVNMFIKAMNWLITQLNKVQFSAPDWVPGIGGKSVGINIPQLSEMQVPRLATGAVIPPNREFAAILGDQKSGTNIETPEDLLRKIYREESGGANAEVLSVLQAILEAVREGKVLMVDKRQLGKVVQEALGNLARASGTAVIPT